MAPQSWWRCRDRRWRLTGRTRCLFVCARLVIAPVVTSKHADHHRIIVAQYHTPARTHARSARKTGTPLRVTCSPVAAVRTPPHSVPLDQLPWHLPHSPLLPHPLLPHPLLSPPVLVLVPMLLQMLLLQVVRRCPLALVLLRSCPPVHTPYYPQLAAGLPLSESTHTCPAQHKARTRALRESGEHIVSQRLSCFARTSSSSSSALKASAAASTCDT